jgi:hypothetical protein
VETFWHLILKRVFIHLLIYSIVVPAFAASNFHVVCAENVTGTTGARDFFVMSLQEPANLTTEELRADFFHPNTQRPVAIAIRHYRGLQHEAGQDVLTLLTQMNSHPERRRGDLMIININFGMGRLSYRGDYRGLNGEVLSDRERWIRLTYSNFDNVPQRTYNIDFADRGFGAGTQNLLMKTYTCSAPDFFTVVEREETSTVPSAEDMASGPANTATDI